MRKTEKKVNKKLFLFNYNAYQRKHVIENIHTYLLKMFKLYNVLQLT